MAKNLQKVVQTGGGGDEKSLHPVGVGGHAQGGEGEEMRRVVLHTHSFAATKGIFYPHTLSSSWVGEGDGKDDPSARGIDRIRGGEEEW